jgi:AraC-like DNA-binding protein
VIGPVVEFALERGVPAGQLERIVPLTAAAPVAGARAHALWTFVARALDERALPWRVAGRLGPADYGAYGFALQASASPRDALARATRLLPSIATTIAFHLSCTARGARLTVRRRDDALGRGARIGTTYVVGQVARVLDAISGGVAAPSAIFLADASDAEIAALGRSLPARPEAGAHGPVVPREIAIERSTTTALEFSAPGLDVPLPRRDPELARHLDAQLAAHADRSVRATARRAIEEHLARGQLPTEERIAEAHGTSCRSLRRHLAQQGTSWRLLVDEVRLERAAVELAHGDRSLSDLAAELGFSDQTAFTRAFARWTGRPPGAYRHAARQRAARSPARP